MNQNTGLGYGCLFAISSLEFLLKNKKTINNIPESIRKHLPKYDGNVDKDILSSQRLSIAPIKNQMIFFFRMWLHVKRHG